MNLFYFYLIVIQICQKWDILIIAIALLQELVFPTMEVTNLHEATRIFPSSTDPSTNEVLTPTPERSQTPQGFEHKTTVDSELLESQLINKFFPEHTRKKTFNATVGDHESIWEEMFRMANMPIMKNADINVLAAIIFIFNMQIRYNISDIGISAYYWFMGAFANPPNERGKFPTNKEKAVKTLKTVGLETKTIHACRDDCILYYGPHEKLDTCPLAKNHATEMTKLETIFLWR